MQSNTISWEKPELITIDRKSTKGANCAKGTTAASTCGEGGYATWGGKNGKLCNPGINATNANSDGCQTGTRAGGNTCTNGAHPGSCISGSIPT